MGDVNVNIGLWGLVLLLVVDSDALFVERQERGQQGDTRQGNKAILEMLHIDRVSATRPRARPQPYMRRVYERLETECDAAQDGLKDVDGTLLVQSFRSVSGKGPTTT